MPVTILVVDDDPVIQKLLTVNFEMEGYHVVTAGGGEDALRLIAEKAPDIILLDVMMPRMDGVEVVRRLKADEVTASIPVIMLSAKAQANDISGGLDAGADDYITKPFDPLELLDKVAALLGDAAPEAPT
ncbi:MAG: response regulator transcription factor [Acidimicrobiales bacterium]